MNIKFDELVSRWPLLGQMQSEIATRGIKMDAADVQFFFARQLTQIFTKTYDVKYAELMARKCFPINREVAPGAEVFVYRQYDQVGMARIINNYAKDFPRVDVRAKEFTGHVKEIGSAYGYNWKELQAALFTGIPLEQRRANMAKRAIFQTENDVIWFGDTDNNLLGILTNTNIPTVSLAADGTGGSTKFADKTAAQILRDMNSMFTDVRKQSKGVEIADTLLMSVDAYAYISATPYATAVTGGTVVTNETILSYFLKTSPDCKEVVQVNELGAVAGSTYGGNDVMIAYKRDEDHCFMVVPQEFFMAPPQMEGFEWTIPCMASTGGFVTPYPLSIRIANDI